MSVFHGIPMNVIHMAIEIACVTDEVFPETPLPYPPLALAATRPGVHRSIARGSNFENRDFTSLQRKG